MGRYGQAILTIAGTVVGAYFGYPALGAALGSLAGSLLFPTQLPTVSGPRLNDLTQTTSAVGTGIPRGWGTFPVPGIVVYQSDLREVIVDREVGGKGGPSQTVEEPTYYQDFRILLCEGEDPIALLEPIAGIRRMWANGKVIYDRRPQQAGESDSDFNQRIAASNVLDEQIVIYLGTEDQEPDPTMEADLGVGNVSGMRGVASVMFINWQNKPEDGNKMPLNWRFEVYTSGALNPNTAFEYSNEYLPRWNAGADIPLSSEATYRFNVEATGWMYASGRGRVSGSWSSLAQAISAAEAVALRTADNFQGYSITPFSGATAARGVTNFMDPRRTVGSYDAYRINLHFNHYTVANWGRSGNSLAALMAIGLAPGVRVHSNGLFLNNDVHNPATAGVYHWWPGNYWSGAAQRRSLTIDHAITSGRSINPGAILITGDMIITVRRQTQAPGDQCAIEVPNLPGYCISTRGNLVRIQSWDVFDTGTFQQAKVLARLRTGQVQIPGESINHQVTVVEQYPLNPALPDGHPNDTQAFWEPYYDQAVAAGLMPAGLTYGVDYPKTQQVIYRRQISQNTIDTNPVPLPDVMGDIFRESGYSADDYDVSGLTGQTILGYVRPRVMPGRAVAEPLRQSKFFDVIESGVMQRKLKCVLRGRPIQASLTSDDLGVAVEGEESPSLMTTATADETTLPRTVRVHYLSLSRDYEPGEQISPARIETRATNDVDIELALVLEDDEAAQIAEVLWSDAWTARVSHQAVIDYGRQELEAADPIEVPVDGATQRVRIVGIGDAFPAVRRLELVRDDDGSYVSHAVGTSPGYTRIALYVPSPAEVILLDLPALRDEDDDAGIYAAVRPYLTDTTFRGATIVRSADGGGTYTSLGPVGTATPVGYLLQSVDDALHTIWDESTVVRVQMQYGDLESRTEDAVLDGANAAAIGAHGRWEIIQFRDAEHVGNGIWLLSGLLRGRRGTEHNIGTALQDDRFVMLSMGGLVRLPLNVSEVGLSRMYKAVATGTAFADAATQEFTGQGEALKPFSPVHLDAVVEDDNDILLTWIRRGRLGQTLQDGIDVPLSEATEAYEVDVLVEGTVMRTLEVTEQQATYTAAQQAADAGSPAATTFTFNVYQISADVGRGHVGTLEVILEDLEAEPPTVDVPDEEIDQTDADAIVVPLVYDEIDEAVSPLTWTRQGAGPRITSAGMLGDGYEARLRATAGLPGFATSSSGPLLLRATVALYGGARAARDVIASVCVNDATANPRLELCVLEDSTIVGEPMVAARSFTGSAQTQRMARKDWRFAMTHPEKTSGAFTATPHAVCVLEGDVFIGAHYQGNYSRVHRCDGATGALLSTFQMGAGDTEIAALTVRESDVTLWAIDADSQMLYGIDVDASFLSGSMVATDTFDVTAITGIGSAQWVTVGTDEDAVEYLLITQFATSGTPYLYLIAAADVTDGGAFTLGDELKRLQLPNQVRGVDYREGLLYIASQNDPTGGMIRVIDFDTWVDSGTDGQLWSVYDTEVFHYPPTEQVGAISFDDAGTLWSVTEGLATAGDASEFLAAWTSRLLGPEANICSLFYDGAGTVTIRMNDKVFTTQAWTPTPTPACIVIGGPPQAAAGDNAGFFIGTVRNVIVQGTDYNPVDYDDAIVYETEGNLEEQPVEISDARASGGSVAAWTNELGALAVGGANTWFFGGNNAQTTSYQRITLTDYLEAAVIDAGDVWAILQWLATSFDDQPDTNSLGFRFRDVSLGLLSSSVSGASAPGDLYNSAAVFPGFIPKSYGTLIPAGTRYIDIVIDLVRGVGTENSAYIDDISMTLHVPVVNEE